MRAPAEMQTGQPPRGATRGRAAYAEVVVFEEGKAGHDADIDELAGAAKVVLKVGAGRLLRDAPNVQTTARHCARARADTAATSVPLLYS